ncbi:MAG: tetratricopeptide repeat protein, partial [Thermodesulfobacteriota bacterium]|nr:tetratricopeptide repeat protein [Thermodesulfobacteriota bacterium]
MTRQTIIILLMILFLPMPAMAASMHDLVEEGNKAYEEARYDDALARYEQAAKKDPDQPQAYFNRGNALYRQEKFSQAISAYEQAAGKSRDN